MFDPARRLRSIISCQALAFDSPLTGLWTGVTNEYQELMDFDQNPSLAKAERLVSIVKAHSALFGAGLAGTDARILQEEPKLLGYIAAKAKTAPKLKRAAILPHTLGASFVRKGRGWPLFGRFRPQQPPLAEGILLCYQAIEADGVARFQAAIVDKTVDFTWQGLGVRIHSQTAWLKAVIVPDSYSELGITRELYARTPSLGPAASLKNLAKPTRIGFYRHELAIAATKTPVEKQSFIMDPLNYQYSFLFWDAGDSSAALACHLVDVWNGRFGLPERDAELAARAFIQRLL